MMQSWFPDAKLGIFIHWGIYAVEGTAESWAIFSKERTYDSYLSVVKQTPAGRDLIASYAQAMCEAGLKVGLYFSHLDWSHPDYAPLPRRNVRRIIFLCP